ncbi:alpha/beta hydrolase [Kutzneria sp. CA-103260]|uniref:alpha/beta hydrolase n=1 Tax=Kutzneria sp. CA-103260 TaxID=2802641 RepID=UPI001BAD9EA8|nr:alpha/beta hydrolase [Kutzneria sp. CA-103260]QUQ63734.1 alpha/beta hydrolase [Kutzneria sp. CA-103260]
MPLDPMLLAAIVGTGILPPSEAKDPEEQRKLAVEYERAVFPTLGLDGPDAPTKDHVLSMDGYPDVLVRLFYPSEPVAGQAIPACLFFFGGAWRQGGLHHPSVAATCARRAVQANVVVAAVSYALAPEHPYPAALEQGYAALEWLVREGESLGVDPNRIGVSGQSAGGNLTAALTHLNRARARHPLAFQILEVPALDLTMGNLDHDAVELPEEQWASLRQMVDDYAPNAEDVLTPTVSPLLADNFDGLPPAYIFTAEVDPLRGDGEAYAMALAADGVPTAVTRLIGLPHEGPAYERVSSTARVAQAAIVDILRSLHT